MVVLNIDARDAVAGRGDEVGGVEADFERSRRDVAVPVDIAITQTQVPLADDGGRIPGLFQNRGKRRASGLM